MKQKKCNWTGGYKWSTAMALSITLGGFGADRFVPLFTLTKFYRVPINALIQLQFDTWAI